MVDIKHIAEDVELSADANILFPDGTIGTVKNIPDPSDDKDADNKQARNAAIALAQRKAVTVIVGFTDDCDYKCDGTADNVQIQDALIYLDTLTPKGGTILLRKGTYDIQRDARTALAVYLTETRCVNTRIVGEGQGTLLNLNSPSVQQTYIFNLLHSGCEVSNMAFGHPAGLVNYYNGDVAVRNTSNALISNCSSIYNGHQQQPYKIEGSDNVKLLNCYVKYTGTNDYAFVGCAMANSTNVLVQGCYFDAGINWGGTGYGVSVGGASSNIQILDNIISHYFNCVCMYADNVAGQSNIVVMGNKIMNCHGAGIWVAGSHVQSDFVMSNNLFSNCTVKGILCSKDSGNVLRATVAGNHFANVYDGIEINSYAVSWAIHGNHMNYCTHDINDGGSATLKRDNVATTGEWDVDDLGGLGEIALTGEADTTITTAGTFYKLAGTTAWYNLSWFDLNAVSNRLRYVGKKTTGRCRISACMAFTSSVVGHINIKVMKNGDTPIAQSEMRTVKPTTGDATFISLQCITAVAQNDYFEIWGTIDNTNGSTIRLKMFNFICQII